VFEILKMDEINDSKTLKKKAQTIEESTVFLEEIELTENLDTLMTKLCNI
jgi:hypothetical protein